MGFEYSELICPFCDKGKITCMYVPSSFSVKQNKSRVMGSSKKIRNPDIWVIKSGCYICGRTREEVEKELKNRNII